MKVSYCQVQNFLFKNSSAPQLNFTLSGVALELSFMWKPYETFTFNSYYKQKIIYFNLENSTAISAAIFALL
ncbi:hypothetical protein CH328_00145 [Mycoplasmopsis bovis]|nr:hypothetical protein AAV31_00125 [Mycoplasmopsis bovis]AQU85343.1 hypothetical protein B0W43_00125 [Mycoplasmopsis bovis]ATQ39980.1 hypothetical protein B8187_00130 [Mycoplasmopsis bovis]AXJ68158.1 hypothetical protein CH319_00115 [Mycoplasmopsis bovis]AXJ69684.1 hypothetical protein CH328_00145 [Mycoplasmopsis bovis]